MGCFHVLTIVNNAALNTGVQIAFRDPALNSSGYISRSRIPGSYGNSTFNSLRNSHTVFHSSCIILHSHQQYVRVPVILTNTCFSFLFSTANRVGVMHCLIMVLVCISLMTNNVEHLFMCLFSIHLSPTHILRIQEMKETKPSPQ